MGPGSQGPMGHVTLGEARGSAPWFPKHPYTRARVPLGLPPGGDPFDQRAKPGQALVALRLPYRLCP
jgi:hypothetical protein